MLTIHNIRKLEGQKVAHDWTVSSACEKLSTYSITLRTEKFPYQRVLELSRFVELQPNGNYEYFFFNEQGRKTHTSIRLEQIRDMDNVVKALNWFTL